MPVVVILAIVSAGILLVVRGTSSGRDLPERITGAAAGRYPDQLRDWGQAMVAELSHVRGGVRRWRFALGTLRIALFPPPRGLRRAALVAAVGLAIAAAASVAAAQASNMVVFVAVLGALMAGYAAVVLAGRPWRPAVPHLIVAAVGVAGVGATIATVTRVAIAHPSATSDPTHVFSVLLAMVLAGYLALALTPPRDGRHVRVAAWWGLGGVAASTVGAIAYAWAVPIDPAGAIPPVSPVAAAATLAVAVGAAVVTRDWSTGIRAGMLTTILGAPVQFTVTMTALLQAPHYTLTDPHDIAAFATSGYPDVASYLLSDTLGGEILAGLLLAPLALLAVAAIGAAAGAGGRSGTGGRSRTAQPTS